MHTADSHKRASELRRPTAQWALVVALLLFVALGYPACYLVTRASHGIVHVHWGALGRGGCSYLEPSGGGSSAPAWAPAMAAETVVRETIDDEWGSCPAITE